MPTFLLKTEPDDYSLDDLRHDRRTAWAGVSNPAALTHLRAMRVGDEAFIYHTGGERAIVGLAKVVKRAYEDPARPGLTADGEAKFAVVDIAFVRAAKSPVTLTAIKADRRFSAFALVRQGRLSVMPVPPPLDTALREMTSL